MISDFTAGLTSSGENFPKLKDSSPNYALAVPHQEICMCLNGTYSANYKFVRYFEVVAYYIVYIL